jgi:hypothetical protein
MKRLIAVCSVIGLLVIGALAAGAAPADFSGTWVLDKAKSQGLSERMVNVNITMVVTQDAKQLTSETSYSGGEREMPPQKATYNLDGSETSVEMGGRMPGKATLKAKWQNDGKTLELNSVRQANIQGNDVTITQQDHWELGDGGKTLKLHRVSENPRGKQESTLMFNKK